MVYGSTSHLCMVDFKLQHSFRHSLPSDSPLGRPFTRRNRPTSHGVRRDRTLINVIAVRSRAPGEAQVSTAASAGEAQLAIAREEATTPI